ncbi:MAG: hypothetical protein JSU09_07720 [Bacteroidetes bacterium]|nr:hypothetical protein [Bacteroidota bacterium]
MISAKEFYQGYQADYFAYRQIRLKKELLSLSNNLTTNRIDEIYGYSIDDHIRSIKIDIRQTYFQSIETLFELIFSFVSDGKRLSDGDVLSNLIKRKGHYESIRKYAVDSSGMEFLEQTFDFGENGQIPAIQYLFYGFLKDSQLGGQLSESLNAIRKILKIIAVDISDRKEYNAYKHGLRIFPVNSFFSFHDHKTGDEIIKWDIKDSMSFMERDEKTGQIDVVTKLFDSERDHNLTIMCNNLISNIILIRRISYQEGAQTVGIVLFKTEDVDKLSKPNVKIQDLKISLEPIDNES